MKVDHAKNLDEKLIDHAATVLSGTIPEQKVDAMKDYHKVIGILKQGTDWRFKPLISKLDLLYIFPGRKLHNDMIVELHELRESMQEKRIDSEIERQRKKDLGSLGDTTPSKGAALIFLAVLALILWR